MGLFRISIRFAFVCSRAVDYLTQAGERRRRRAEGGSRSRSRCCLPNHPFAVLFGCRRPGGRAGGRGAGQAAHTTTLRSSSPPNPLSGPSSTCPPPPRAARCAHCWRRILSSLCFPVPPLCFPLAGLMHLGWRQREHSVAAHKISTVTIDSQCLCVGSTSAFQPRPIWRVGAKLRGPYWIRQVAAGGWRETAHSGTATLKRAAIYASGG
jgi:hypothetical protein